MASGPTWTPQEDAIMRQYYPTEFGKVAKRLPGRSKKTIYVRATNLGLVKKMETAPERWSEEELQTLKAFYPTEGAAVSKRLNNRTPAAIRLQARTLGIKYRNNWTKAEDDILREHYAEEGVHVAARLPNRTQSACLGRAKVLELTRERNQNSDSPNSSEQTA